ncbi:uncharacterized protein BYT42DRAFT_573164 [Radiomyces spectabilis]|uniref:uncharacterized protein n=1 Tax=Radiomyces spectabilis TaxID=64574 RepID=UPI00221E4189|nr:uncharacterized protein BYT42DRAFT_573164 [Radiomyces spectabilis]KAI8376031.1 hypothetical protein BYT42DRAFT_573164 [Radiomyces spectabilis]
MSLTYVVTGASRGIGLEFIKQLSSKGHTVVACARAPEKSEGLKQLVDNKKVYAVTLDTVNEASVKSAVEKITEIAGNGVDVLINNAGISGDRKYSSKDSPASEYMSVFETNVVGTSNITQAMLPLLKKSQTRHIINISSNMGSHANTTSGNLAAYRVSKAAENMLTNVLASDLKDDKFVVVSVHPGWVQTDMGGSNAHVTPQQSVQGILAKADTLEVKDNGIFFDYEGKPMDW